jgi:hypothetical protein
VGEEGLESNSVEIDEGDGARPSLSLMLSSIISNDARSGQSLLELVEMADPSEESTSFAEHWLLFFC